MKNDIDLINNNNNNNTIIKKNKYTEKEKSLN